MLIWQAAGKLTTALAYNLTRMRAAQNRLSRNPRLISKRLRHR